MELIRTDEQGRELGYVLNGNIDMEVGEDEKNSINDFEVEFRRENWDGGITYGSRLICLNTEFGGIVKQIYTDTEDDSIKVKGYTWRGMMIKKVIKPPEGKDYKVVSGELNQIIRESVEKEFPGLFYGVLDNTGIYVNNYQYERHCTLHAGLVKMLKSVGYRLDIRYCSGDMGDLGYVQVKAAPIIDYSSEYELSNDNNMNFTIDDNRRGVNHLICLGKGELKDRMVIDLYVDASGRIGQTQYYKGIDEVTEIYDSNGSERADLLKNGTEKLETLKSKTEYNMTMKKLEGEIDIGDIVGGKDFLTGISVKKPIDRKIWTISEGVETISYKLKGET